MWLRTRIKRRSTLRFSTSPFQLLLWSRSRNIWIIRRYVEDTGCVTSKKPRVWDKKQKYNKIHQIFRYVKCAKMNTNEKICKTFVWYPDSFNFCNSLIRLIILIISADWQITIRHTFMLYAFKFACWFMRFDTWTIKRRILWILKF